MTPPSNWEPPPAPWVPGAEKPPPLPGISPVLRVLLVALAIFVVLVVVLALRAKGSSAVAVIPPPADVTRDAVVLADDLLAGRLSLYEGRRVAIMGLALRSSGRAVTFEGRPKLAIPATMRTGVAMPRTPLRAMVNCRATRRGQTVVFDDCIEL